MDAVRADRIERIKHFYTIIHDRREKLTRQIAARPYPERPVGFGITPNEEDDAKYHREEQSWHVWYAAQSVALADTHFMWDMVIDVYGRADVDLALVDITGKIGSLPFTE